MRAVNSIAKQQGDDFNTDRLLFYLQERLSVPVRFVKQIRKNIFYMLTDEGSYVLKDYSSLKKLRLHETFTDSLKREGFHNTYVFRQDFSNIPLFFNGHYYGVIEYLKPTKKTFSYSSDKERTEALRLLTEFHSTTEKLSDRYKNLISPFSQKEKWIERFQEFKKNIPFLKYYIHDYYLANFIHWGQWSLQHLESNYDFFEKNEKVIIHGDVAHHNFIRTKNGLYLIDFDLISYAPASIDLLQFSNRILPIIAWSLEDLKEYKQLQPLLTEQTFLTALAYPSDIYREWNRLIREQDFYNTFKLKHLYSMTINQFEQRLQFFKNIEDVVK